METNLFTDAASGALKTRRFRVVVVAGPDEGLRRDIEVGTMLVGTHPNNDLRLSGKGVSRFHLELQVRDGGLMVTDPGSTNGTFQGAMRIRSVVLAGPALLRLGPTTEIEIAPDDVDVDLPPFAGESFGQAIGAAPPMLELFALLTRAAESEATILLEGETGTGKELLAEGVHLASPRARGVFIVVDCGALPRELIASELFGHVRGAFTGADAPRRGLIEEADGGTLFLDEVGELPLDLQPQLLRVLEKREVRAVGDVRTRKVSIRVVAATHRDLPAMVRAGEFREDLFFRLAVVRARVPPLRRRKEDIPLLVERILHELGRGDFTVPGDLLAKLATHDWPGNVRELRNVVERSLSLSAEALWLDENSAAISGTLPGMPPPGVLDRPFKEAKGLLLESFEREYLTHLLARHKGNISKAAQEAGIDRNYIHRLIKKYSIPIERP